MFMPANDKSAGGMPQVVILAGGLGTRLGDLTKQMPKSLIQVGNQSILSHILDWINEQGCDRALILTGHLGEQFDDFSHHSVSLTFVKESEPLGTGGALGLLPAELIKSSFIMVNGDILTNLNWRRLLDFHNKSGVIATMCLRKYEYSVPYGVVESLDGRVTQMIEKPTQYFDINAGVYAVSPELLCQIKADEAIDMPTILEKNIDAGNHISVFPIHESWIDVGGKDDLLRAEQQLKTMGLD